MSEQRPVEEVPHRHTGRGDRGSGHGRPRGRGRRASKTTPFDAGHHGKAKADWPPIQLAATTIVTPGSATPSTRRVQRPGAWTRSRGHTRPAVRSPTDGPEYGGAPDGNIEHIKSQGGGQHKTQTPEAKETPVTYKNLQYLPGHHDGTQEALPADQRNPGGHPRGVKDEHRQGFQRRTDNCRRHAG